MDRYPDLKTTTLVFIASSFGFLVLISTLIILLYRIAVRSRQQRELQARLRTISELLGELVKLNPLKVQAYLQKNCTSMLQNASTSLVLFLSH